MIISNTNVEVLSQKASFAELSARHELGLRTNNSKNQTCLLTSVVLWYELRNVMQIQEWVRNVSVRCHPKAAAGNSKIYRNIKK